MATLIGDFIAETSSAPGTSATISLAGAISGRVAFVSQFTNGASVFYYMFDNVSVWECGIGTFNTGAPNTLTRTTVLANSSGTLVKLNFTGTTYVYNEVPASKAVVANVLNDVWISGNLFVKDTGHLLPANNTNGVYVFGRSTGQVGSAGFLIRGSVGGDIVECQTVGVEAFRVNSLQNICLGIASNPNTSRLSIMNTGGNSNISSNSTGTAATNHVIFNNNTSVNVGSINTTGSTTAYATTSDRRTKITHGISDADSDFILSLPVYDAEWKSDGRRYPMCIADEVQSFIPAAVQGEKDAVNDDGSIKPQSWDASILVPALIRTVQKLEARIAVLEETSM